MAIRNIVKYGDDILRKKSREITEFDGKLWTLLDDMAETMYKANGVGLAAPQVGILKKVVVINTDGVLYELINPEIIHTEGEQTGYEGCLSFPDECGIVSRPMKVKAVAMDRNGKKFEIEGEGLLARALCHEIDHLKGVLFIDLADEMVETE